MLDRMQLGDVPRKHHTSGGAAPGSPRERNAGATAEGA
jgi:hypothetical protein